MALVDLQRRIVSLCYDREPSPGDLELLGDRRVWSVYRTMVRGRLLGEAKLGLPRTLETVGREAFEAQFDAYLASDPPRTRLFWQIVVHFARFAAGAWRKENPLAADLAAYEGARWEVRDLPGYDGPALAEFDFDKRPVLTPALRLVRAEHAVHRKPPDGEQLQRGRFNLCVYRRGSESRARTWSVNDACADLMELWISSPCTVSESVRRVAQARGFEITQSFVDRLCTLLADFIEQEIVLGSAPC